MEVLRIADATLLLAFASIYLGTGVTEVFFVFPIQSKLTPETYKVPFIDPVVNATNFFRIMTILMLIGSAGMIALELGTAYWIPIAAYLLFTVGATVLTTQRIFAVNAVLEAGMTDPVALQQTLTRWRQLNLYRAGFWVLEWIAITTWWVFRVA
ncbi:MAG: hypothetical protein QOE28_2119 [Solirubrobacteraceae bacterium]|nr:hypothetical protein [Solirubrobacteraceae bacterium]